AGTPISMGDLLGAALEFGPSLHEDDKELAEDRIPLYSSASRMTGAQIAGFAERNQREERCELQRSTTSRASSNSFGMRWR
ncbi:hypothetical protein J7E70_10900, partial [Variovorax paradoxus]